MFDFAPTPRRSFAAQRREAVRLLQPLLTSARLVRLFQKVGMLSATRPTTIAALEIVIDQMARPRPARATLRRRSLHRAHAGGRK